MSPLPAAAHRVAVDVVALTLDRRPGDESQQLVVLAVRRQRPPFPNSWALAGSLVRLEEDLTDAALRALGSRGGLHGPRHLEQLATFGAPRRDPRGRVVTVSYLALLPSPPAPADGARWWPVAACPPLAFDHARILDSAVDRLRGKLSYSNVAYGLLPDTFTLTELQAVYAAVLGREVDKRNFRKKVLNAGMVTEAEGQRRGPHRPAQLYRFTRPDLLVLDNVISA